MRILVFGKDGQLGKALARYLTSFPDVIFVGKSECDLGFKSQIHQCLKFYQPKLIINASGYTNVDAAESACELSYAINEFAVGAMAQYCETHSVRFIHFSTDYVFDGKKIEPYVESDICRPLNIYGRSKLNGEILTQKIFNNSKHGNESQFLIIRTSWMYGDGENFIRKILRLSKESTELKVISDQFGVPTDSNWLGKLTVTLIKESRIPSGVYHAVPPGVTTWCELARYSLACAKKAGLVTKLLPDKIFPTPSYTYPMAAKRPNNSRLATGKLQSFLLEPNEFFCVNWEDQVKTYVDEIVRQGI